MKPQRRYTPPYNKPSALSIACATFARTMKPTTSKPYAKQRRTTAARPNDRVTDNRAAFYNRLDTLRSATRRTHLDEPTTDARVSA